jgi:thioredoxin reductase
LSIIDPSLGDDVAPEDALDVLPNAIVGEGEHLDGFRPTHFVVFLAPVSLGIDQLAVLETLEVMRNQIRSEFGAIAQFAEVEWLVRLDERLEDPESRRITERTEDVRAGFVYVVVRLEEIDTHYSSQTPIWVYRYGHETPKYARTTAIQPSIEGINDTKNIRMSESVGYDVVILGGGAAAFAAITEASRRDLSTTMVNTGLPIGGTCINVGCVPSKHLLTVAEAAFESPNNPFDAVEYSEGEPNVDWAAALNEKDDLVGQLRRENYVDVAEHFETDIYEGYGRFVDSTTIEVIDGPDEDTRITGERALIATGSSPWSAPIDGLETIDNETSETILERRALPESMVILGGSYIALEWGQILHRVGVDVTILQRSERVLSGMEGQLGREMQQCFRDEGIDVVTDTDFQQVTATAADGGMAA